MGSNREKSNFAIAILEKLPFLKVKNETNLIAKENVIFYHNLDVCSCKNCITRI